MLPVFATNRLDAFILGAAFFIWLLPEVISSFTDTKGKDIKVHDRASGVVLLICIWLGGFFIHKHCFCRSILCNRMASDISICYRHLFDAGGRSISLVLYQGIGKIFYAPGGYSAGTNRRREWSVSLDPSSIL